MLNNDPRYLINRVIVLPLALKTFVIDQKQFENLYIGNVWIDKLDSAIRQIQSDIPKYKEELYSQHKIIIQEVSKTEYKLMQGDKSKIIFFTSDELKSLTSDIMTDYLYGSSAKRFNKTNRTWKLLGMQPPDIDLDTD